MDFIHNDLGYRQGGEVVEISLSGRLNVRLTDSGNFSSYRNVRHHRFYGGQATKSPTRLQIPLSGHWHVAIDLGGYSGRIRAGVRVLPGMLRPMQEISLTNVPSLVHRRDEASVNEEQREHDVFISYASEDRDEVVRPLVLALRAGGLSVWFDEFDLKIGDSLRRKIDRGLANSRFGVVVLSKSFFGKGWTNYELDGLVTRAVSGEQIILPIWHDVSKREVIQYSASLADKVARNTASHTPDEIAAEIIEVISSSYST